MSSTPTILKVAVNKPLFGNFDYLTPDNAEPHQLLPGSRIQVPFGRSTLTGVIVAAANESDYPEEKLKQALECLDDSPTLSSALLKLCRWASDYYHHPLGEVIHAALPPLLKKGKEPKARKIKPAASEKKSPVEKHVLNTEQQVAVDTVLTKQTEFFPALLEGVTGSGKTEVYAHLMEAVLKAGKQVLVLVPEIGLTPQTVARFTGRFSEHESVAVYHSGLTDRQRLTAWKQMKSGEGSILIGTRSALLCDFHNLGLIIVDEEHDPSFKQQEGFRYSARDMAVVRGRFESIPVVLGSATPALETLHNANLKRYTHLVLPKRAGAAVQPQYKLLDCRKKRITGGISDELSKTMVRHLEAGNQVLLFINRRGFAPQLLCHQCGWNAACEHCDAKMTFHLSKNILHCHHCDTRAKVPPCCPVCKASSLITAGVGTEKVEAALQEQFSDYPVLRIDSDSTRKKGAMEDFLAQIHTNKPQILIGTQMLAKGHHFPKVTLVAILSVDNNLLSPDFRNMERLGQLICQVAGRAGREEARGEVILQTHYPDHPLLQCLIREGYGSLAKQLLEERYRTGLPPYSHGALLRASSKEPMAPVNFLNDMGKGIEGFVKEKGLGVTCFGPIPAPMLRKADHYRGQLFVSGVNRGELHTVLDYLIHMITGSKLPRHLHWSLDVDPVDTF